MDFTEFLITEEAVRKSATHILPAGTVVVASRVGLGKVARVRRETAINQDLRGFLPKRPDQLDEQYLFYWFKSVAPRIVAAGTGATVQGVTLAFLRALQMPLPHLEEQRRIVAVLDEAFATIAIATANAGRNVELVAELSTARIRDIFSSHLQDDSEATTVESLAAARKGSMRTGPFGSQLLHSEFVDAGVVVLGIDNAVENVFRWGKRRFISEEKFEQLSRFLVHPGDVIITIMGTCGRCAIVPDDIPKAINSKHLFCITLDKQKCLPEYLHAYFLHAPEAREYLAERAQGSIMDGLNMGIIKEMPIQIPPLAKQREIIEAINAVTAEAGAITAINRRRIEALSQLKQSLLHRAFSGELTGREPLAA